LTGVESALDDPSNLLWSFLSVFFFLGSGQLQSNW